MAGHQRGQISKDPGKVGSAEPYVDKELGVFTINRLCSLCLENRTKVNLPTISCYSAIWTIVTCVAKFWIVSGDRNLANDHNLFFNLLRYGNLFGDRSIVGEVTMASISKKGKVILTLTIKLTSNGYKNSDGKEFAGIYTLQKVYVTGMQGIMIAIERDGSCHLISVDYGRLSILHSIDSIVPSKVDSKSQRIVMSVTTTGTRGEFIVGGFGWTKLINVKLK